MPYTYTETTHGACLLTDRSSISPLLIVEGRNIACLLPGSPLGDRVLLTQMPCKSTATMAVRNTVVYPNRAYVIPTVSWAYRHPPEIIFTSSKYASQTVMRRLPCAKPPPTAAQGFSLDPNVVLEDVDWWGPYNYIREVQIINDNSWELILGVVGGWVELKTNSKAGSGYRFWMVG